MSRFRTRRESGATAVEFALVLPFMLVIVFGIIQYGWYFYAMQSGTSAAGDAVRRLSVGACQVKADRDSFLKTGLGAALNGTDVTTDSVKYTDAAGAASATPVVGGSATLTVAYPTLNLNFPFVPLPNDGVVTRTQTARVESATAAAGVSCS